MYPKHSPSIGEVKSLPSLSCSFQIGCFTFPWIISSFVALLFSGPSDNSPNASVFLHPHRPDSIQVLWLVVCPYLLKSGGSWWYLGHLSFVVSIVHGLVLLFPFLFADSDRKPMLLTSPFQNSENFKLIDSLEFYIFKLLLSVPQTHRSERFKNLPKIT